MRSRNNNFKIKGVAENVLCGAGFVSVGVLTLLGILAISPITNKTDAANGWDEELKNYRESASTVTLSMDSGTNSVVNAGNTNTNVGVVKRTASVTLGNTNGYSVYIRANSANLTGSNSSNTIPSVTSNSTLSQMTDKWGWNGSVGDNVTDCSLSDVFKQMTTSNQTLGTGGAISSGTKKVTMCFGTRVSEAKVADTYSNTVTLSVVAEPGRVTPFNGVTDLQRLSASVCNAAPYHETAYMTDIRDGKKYWITKMLDGNCWMSQNLALDIEDSSSVMNAHWSDIKRYWSSGHSSYPPQNTTNSVTTGTTSNTGTYSWNLGNYVIINPTGAAACDSNNVGLSNCAGQFTNVNGWTASDDPNFYKNNGNSPINAATKTYDAHYLVGNYYQWNAATAGTGGSITNTNATDSICPRNWKLPNSGASFNNTSGSFDYLLSQYGVQSSLEGTSNINGNAYNITQSPLFFVRSGLIASGNSAPFQYAGRVGYGWSSRAHSDTGYAYVLNFYTSVTSSYSSTRSSGLSLRCYLSPTSKGEQGTISGDSAPDA